MIMMTYKENYVKLCALRPLVFAVSTASALQYSLCRLIAKKNVLQIIAGYKLDLSLSTPGNVFELNAFTGPALALLKVCLHKSCFGQV